MTDVLILRRIPATPAGAIVPLDDRLQGHVDAGNAVIVPETLEAPRSGIASTEELEVEGLEPESDDVEDSDDDTDEATEGD